jgi:hypothetical protein
MKSIICFIIFSTFCFSQVRRDTLVWITRTDNINNTRQKIENNNTKIKMLQEENLRYEGFMLLFNAMDDSTKFWVMKPDTTQLKRKQE